MEDQLEDAVQYLCPSIPKTHPWLLIFQGEHLEKHIFYDVEKSCYHSRTIPEMRRKYLLASAYGWLLLADRFQDDCHLFNPMSKEKIQLPLLKLEYQLGERSISVDYRKARCILTRPPTDPDCQVLVICHHGLMLFCKLGDEEFVVQSTKFGADHLVAAVVFKDQIYGILRPSCKIATIEFFGSTIRVDPVINDGIELVAPQHPPLSTQGYEDYMVESSAEILCVRKIYSQYCSKDVSDFRIFRIDLCNKVCEELNSLGERIIFLSNGMSYSVIAKSRILGNSIYYTQPGDKNLYLYEVEYRSRTMLLPCPNAGSDWLGQSWVMMY